jgi:putative cardiolipin synthase
MTTSSKALSQTSPIKALSMICLLAIASATILTGCSNDQVSPRGVTTNRSAAEESTPAPTDTSTQSTTPVPTPNPPPAALKGVYPLRSGDGSEVADIRTEAELLSTRWNFLDSAKQAVWIQTYVFRGDYAGYQFAKKLVELKKRGIDVKIIVDSEMNFDLPTQGLYARMHEWGLNVVGFNPLYTNFLHSFTNAGDINTYLSRENKRHHEKIFIIDPMDSSSKRAIVGGSNISDDYFSLVKSKIGGGYWRDKDVAVRGPIVDDLANYFSYSYDFHIKLNQTNYPVGPGTIRDVISSIQKLLLKEPSYDPAIVERFRAHVSMPDSLVWHPVTTRFLVESQDLPMSDIYNTYLAMIASAKNDIVIANGYFIPDNVQVKALKDAAKRGVRVRILTNSEETSDYWQVARAGRLLYETLLDESFLPIEIYEWGRPGVSGYSLYHSKYMCIDLASCIVGSFNLDPRSNNLNAEVALFLASPTLASELVADFEKDVAPEHATIINFAMARSFVQPKAPKDILMNAVIKRLLGNL